MLGSTDSKPSLIGAGIVAERLNQLLTLKNDVVAQQEEIIQWLQQYPGSFKSK